MHSRKGGGGAGASVTGAGARLGARRLGGRGAPSNKDSLPRSATHNPTHAIQRPITGPKKNFPCHHPPTHPPYPDPAPPRCAVLRLHCTLRSRMRWKSEGEPEGMSSKKVCTMDSGGDPTT